MPQEFRQSTDAEDRRLKQGKYAPNATLYKSNEQLMAEADEQDYAKEQGATGIAGAGKRAKPEYKSGLEAYRAMRKKKREGITAKDAGDALAKSSEEKK